MHACCIAGGVKGLIYILQKWHSKMHGLWVGGGDKVPKDQLCLKLLCSPLKIRGRSNEGESIPKEQFLQRSGSNNMKDLDCE